MSVKEGGGIFVEREWVGGTMVLFFSPARLPPHFVMMMILVVRCGGLLTK